MDKPDMRRMAQLRRYRSAAVDLSPVVAPLLQRAQRVASYVGFGSEPFVPPEPGWLLPVLREDGDLDWAEHDGELVRGRLGMQQPGGRLLGPQAIAECDLVIVPALLVDRTGVRLGRGGGSYDRALARARGRTVALLHDGELVPALPREDHDVPVDTVATPGAGVMDLPAQ